MALEATHMRFALDLKDHFEVKNICEYLSGTIYPDSRYVSGIDRNLTHPKDLFERKHTELTDFEKGWFAHLICDDVQFELTMEKFPEIAQMEEGQGNGRWVDHTALKILQDMDDVQKFDVQSHLSCLEHVFNPNGEDLEKVREYNAIFPEMYADPMNLTVDSEYVMWEKFGIGDELVERLKESTERQGADSKVRERLSTLYDEMLTTAKKKLEQL